MRLPTLPRPGSPSSTIESWEPSEVSGEPDAHAASRAEPEPERRGSTPRWLVALGLAVILATFAARCALVARSDSITSDEWTHLTHCLHYWMTGDDLAMWELGAPRLPHVTYAWASYQALRPTGLLPPVGSADLRAALTRLVLSGASRVLVPARCLAIGSGLALLLTIFWATARTSGAALGLLATGLASLVPDLIAHSAIAGSDVAFTAAAMVALVLTARYVEKPGPWRWLALALAIGLAWAMRHSALILLPLAAGAHAWCALRAPRPPGVWPVVDRLLSTVLACIGLSVVAFLVLWAGDGFGTVTLSEASESITSLNLPERVGPVDISGLPIPSSLLSILKQVSHQGRGHDAYFLGEVRQQGWPLYFPVAFLLKTPVGLIALMVLAVARVRPKRVWDAVALACLALLWITLMRSKVNIGVRYAMLTYPLAIPFVARLFDRDKIRDRVWGPVTLAAVVWFAGASFASHPRYLSYFNEIGGGPRQGWLYLADSNIDWGQDFDALAATLKRMGLNDVTTDLSTERRLVEPGLCAVPFPVKDLQVPAETPPNRRLYDSEGGYLPVYTRYVAASVSRLMGLYSHNDMSWLRTRRVVARVGDSTFIFDMDRPAERPFGP